MLNKLDDLKLICEISSPDFVCIVETWLDSDVSNNDVFIPDYVCVRLDRNRHGGGIVLYIKHYFQYKLLVQGPVGLELLIVSIFNGPNIGIFYRPPSSPVCVLDSLFDVLCAQDITIISNLILLGDFNINYLSPTMFLYHHLQCILDCFSLKQVVSEATHYSPNGQQSLIDLVLMSFPERLISCDVIPQLGNSDHLGIQVHFLGKSKAVRVQNNPRRQVWHYNRADFNLAIDLLSDRNLDALIEPSDVNLSWSKLVEIFLSRSNGHLYSKELPTQKTQSAVAD